MLTVKQQMQMMVITSVMHKKFPDQIEKLTSQYVCYHALKVGLDAMERAAIEYEVNSEDNLVLLNSEGDYPK